MTSLLCPLCSAEWRCEQEHQAICAEAGCDKPISLCCISSGAAKRCEFCKEWHCAEHMAKTDCGLLCGECNADLVQISPAPTVPALVGFSSPGYTPRIAAIGAGLYCRVGRGHA